MNVRSLDVVNHTQYQLRIDFDKVEQTYVEECNFIPSQIVVEEVVNGELLIMLLGEENQGITCYSMPTGIYQVNIHDNCGSLTAVVVEYKEDAYRGVLTNCRYMDGEEDRTNYKVCVGDFHTCQQFISQWEKNPQFFC